MECHNITRVFPRAGEVNLSQALHMLTLAFHLFLTGELFASWLTYLPSAVIASAFLQGRTEINVFGATVHRFSDTQR